MAQRVEANPDRICVSVLGSKSAPVSFESFAVRVKRADKSFPLGTSELERLVGQHLLDHLRAAGHPGARVNLSRPGLTCFVEITAGSALIYSEKLPGPGGMPANTAGRLVCLLSGGYDSTVAAYKMMKRGVHVVFAHFHALPSRPGESSAPCRAGAGAASSPVPVHGAPLSGAFRAHPAADRDRRAGALSHPGSTAA